MFDHNTRSSKPHMLGTASFVRTASCMGALIEGKDAHCRHSHDNEGPGLVSRTASVPLHEIHVCDVSRALQAALCFCAYLPQGCFHHCICPCPCTMRGGCLPRNAHCRE